MKKRLLSALLALALVFVLLPTTALAGVTTKSDYDISINGMGWKFDTDGSGACIPVYYYGSQPSNYSFKTDANDKWTTDSNLMLTKKGNTVTITIRPSKYRPNESPEFNLKKESTSTEQNDVPCIKMGNDNNLVITGKGTLNITRNENKSYGAALYSNVGDITINGGITVNVSFLNGKDYYNKNVSSNAIYVGDNHNLTVSGSGTNVIATNQGFHSSPATVCVEGGTITVSGGASLSATNTYDDNRSGSDDVKIQHFNSYAISGTKSNPCTLIVADEKSSVTATTNDFTNIAESWAFKYTTIQAAGATIKAGSSVSNSTVTTIDNISGQRYAKISVPALETTADVLIAKENAVVGVRTSLGEGNGYYTYNKDTKTLTLEDVSITNVAHFIQFWAKDSYTIELKGTNTITGVTSAIRVPEKGYNNESLDGLNVTITGTGSLNVTANTYAIDMQVGNLIFNSTGNITLTTNTNYTVQKTVCNALHVAGSITIDNTKYDIVGARQEKNYPTETISDSSVFDPDYLNGYTVGGETTLFKTITITPAAAKDSTISYGKKTLKQGEIIKGEISGTATVATKGNTITLNNFKGTQALSFEATLADSTLVLEGTNTLSSIVTTQKGLTISGSGSLTVGSIRVTNNYNIHADLTITDGAKVTAGTTTSDAKAIDITGNLTVNSGATLTATNASETNPTIDVTGNVTISGDPGTNAYTVSAHNSYNVQKDRDGNLSPSGVPSAIKIGGTLNISAGVRVMAQTDSYGAGVMLGQNSTITVEDAFLSAKNSSCDFAAISFSGQTGDIYVSGKKGEVVAENIHTGTNLAFRAINAFVYNSNTDFYLNMQSEGVIAEAANKIIAPGKHDASGGKKVTITRGDEVTRTNSPVVIAGTTLRNDTYYTITNGSTVAEGTENNYNAFYDSETKTLKLNNAKISTTTKNAAIKIGEDSTITTITVTGTNELKGNHNHCIESYDNFTINGTGTLNMTNTNSSSSATSVIHCGPGKSLTIAAEVIIKNEAKPGNLILTVTDNAYSFAKGYNVYASTDVFGSPLETYDAAKSSTYKYLRVTKENLAPTTPTPQTPFTIDGIPAQFVDGGMIATTGVTATSSNNINLPIDRVKWYTFTPVFGSDGRMDSVSDKTEATGNFEAGKYYVVEIKFVQDLSPFKSWDMKVSGWSDNDVYRQSVTARNDIEIYFLTPASAATHEHNWVENYDTVYHWKMCTYDGCTAIKDKALHVWNAWHTSNNEQQHSKSCSECSYSTPPHDIDLAYVSDGEQGHHLYCKHDGCTFVTGTTAHNYEEGSNICTDCGYNKSAPCDHTGDHAYTNNGDGTHKVTCKACGATIVEKQNHEFNPTGVCIYCGATQSGGNPTPDNPGTIVIIRPAEEEKPAQQPNPSTGANDLVGLAVAAAVAAALGSAALLRKHD